MLVGDNLLLGLLFYGAVAWSLGALVVGTFLLTMLYARTYYDRSEATGTRAWGWVRRWTLWQWCRRPYRHSVVDAGYAASSEGRRTVPCLFAASPHGVNSWSFLLTFMAQAPDTMQALGGKPLVAVLSWLLGVPVLRECLLAMGAVTVDAATLRHVLGEQRRSIALIPGGTREIAPARHVPLPRRTGFLRLAYDLSAAAQPVDVVYAYMQNEDRVYWTWGNEWRLRQWMLNALGFTITPYVGPLPLAGCPLVTHLGPRHCHVPGESFEDYQARWFAAVDALRRRIG